METCIFCKIVKKAIPCNIRYEDDDIIVFDDINPSAPIHLLIIPKSHIKSADDLDDSNIILMTKITRIAQQLKKDLNIKSYKLITNCGKEAGQEVFHLHVHFKGY